MKDRFVGVSFVFAVSVAMLAAGAIGGGLAQNPPAAGAGARPAQTAPPPKASIEGTITKLGTGQVLRETQISLRRAADVNQDPMRNLPPDANSAQISALRDLMGAVSVLRGGQGGMNPNTAPAVATAVSDKQGHFLITEVEPGDYIVSAERDGYVRQEYGQRTDTSGGAPVALVAGKRTTIDFQLLPAGVISGRVFDGDGLPVTDARIQAYTYRYGGGRRALASVASTQTNDLGEYRLHPLTPGTYFISVTPREGLPTDQIPPTPEPPQTLPFPGMRGGQNVQVLIDRGGEQAALIQAIGLGTPPIYHPGVLDPTEAVPVRVAAAADVRGVDFYLRPIRTFKVSGRVEAPFELPSEQARMEAMQNLLGIMGGAQGRGAFGLQGGGGGVIVAPPQGQGTAGSRGQAPAPGVNAAALARIGNIQEFLGNMQNVQNTVEPIQVRFARVGAESQSPLAALIGNGVAPVNPDGSFQISNVTAGSYNLTAIARDQKGVEYTARMRVEVGAGDINGLTIIPKRGGDIRGQVYADSTPANFKTSQLRVSLVSDDNPNPLNLVATLLGGQSTGGMNASVEADGTFALKNVGALPYRARVTGLPANGYVIAARFGDVDPLGAPFTVGETEALLQLQIGFSPGNVTANVVDASGKPFSGIVTALVPDTSRRGRSDLYFSGTSDASGRVAFANVPPGAYRLFAWEEVPAEAFRYAEFLQTHESRGVNVTVEKNGAHTLEVKAIPKSEN
jgi:hypothetical protein